MRLATRWRLGWGGLLIFNGKEAESGKWIKE